MSVLVYTESDQGTFKKVAFEAASYAKAVADMLGTTVTAVSFNANDTSELSNYGVTKLLNITNASDFDAKIYANAIKQAADNEGANVVIASSTSDGKFVAPLIAVEMEAGYASNVVAAPSSTAPFTVKRTSFSNKAFNHTEISSKNKVIGISKNAFGSVENPTNTTIEEFMPNLISSDNKVQSVDRATDKVTIADADIVVSGGRGLKGPENWAMIEELAEILGAATACSKPVSDLGWRPHSEHVGQTGKPVTSNLYIAIGISGAIQHLAGVNASKVKVVVNTDPEAPFFKAADYGVVGDAFEVVPTLIQKLKEFKAQNA